MPRTGIHPDLPAGAPPLVFKGEFVRTYHPIFSADFRRNFFLIFNFPPRTLIARRSNEYYTLIIPYSLTITYDRNLRILAALSALPRGGPLW
jgi:hypothetical protein